MDRAALDRELRDAWLELTAPGAPFELTSVNIDGYRLRAYARAPRSLAQVWREASVWADRDYLVFGAERLTYGAAHALVGRVSGWLGNQDIARGDRVAIAMRNYPEWLIVYWACVTRGVVAVGLNAWSTADELTRMLAELRARAIFCDGERLARIGDTSDALRVAVRTPSTRGAIGWREVIAADPTFPDDDPVDPDDDASIFYTSGTTGASKGARLSHRGCVNNLLNMRFAAEVQALAIGRASAVAVDLGAASAPVGLATTPLFHVTATNCLAHPITAAGGTLVLMGRWEAGEALRLVERERVTTMGGVPTMTRELLRHPDRDAHDLSSLTTLVGGGAPMPPDLVARVDADPLGARPSTGFGMTEASGIVTAISGEFLVDRPESCGRPMPTFEVQLIDEAGIASALGEAGELCVRGAGVFRGYLSSPQATAETIINGWLRTGDIARIDDDGFVTVVDRKKDLIIRGGENVACAEVEAALFRHPAVLDVCSFGVLDERLGEEVGAAILLDRDQSTTACDLRRHLEPLLSRYKVPRYLWFLDGALPRGSTGKVLRRELRAALDPAEAL